MLHQPSKENIPRSRTTKMSAAKKFGALRAKKWADDLATSR